MFMSSYLYMYLGIKLLVLIICVYSIKMKFDVINYSNDWYELRYFMLRIFEIIINGE